MQFRRNPANSQPENTGRPDGAPVHRSLIQSIGLLGVFFFVGATSAVAITTAGASARATHLHYDAFLSGVPIGTAIVTVDVDSGRYRISGTARSQGVAHLFSGWRSDFLAVGMIEAGQPVLGAYAYDEREKKKHRVLWLTDGTVRQVKNNEVRPSRPTQTGTDILTAFFLAPDCWSDRQLHTGRYSYRITGKPSKHPDGCHFVVTDDDGDRSRFHVRFGEFNGLRVPVEATTRGFLRGSVRLRTGQEKQTTVDVQLADRQ